MTTEIEWGDPPEPTAGRTGRWDAVAEALKERPGQWALIGKNVHRGTGSNLSSGAIKAFREGRWEFTQRGGARAGYDSDRCDLYARYIGPA